MLLQKHAATVERAASARRIWLLYYGGSRKVGTCPQEQIGPKPQVPTLISEAKVGTWSETRQRESWNLYCRERGTAIVTTALVLQRKRNYNCYDCSSIANSKKLQSLRPLHYCEERGTAITTTVPVLQRERNCNCYNRSCIAEKETVIIATLPWLQTTFANRPFRLHTILSNFVESVASRQFRILDDALTPKMQQD